MWFFYIITIIALIIMVMFYRNQKEADELVKVSLIMMMAGTIGNFIDRLCFQHVRDFLDFIIFGYDFPIFNVADIYVSVGTAVLAVLILFYYKDEDLNRLMEKRKKEKS